MSLHRECDAIMSKRQSGAPATLRWRRRTIKNIVNTLAHLRTAPSKLAEVEERHIVELVEHWRDRKLSYGTIGNRLAALRYLFKKVKLNVIPDNKALGIFYRLNDSMPKAIFRFDDLNQIDNLLVRNILAFEFYFGLTRSESIHLDIRVALIAALESDVLLIDRAVARNKKDRVIPVITPEQKQVVAERLELLGDNITLTEIYTERELQKEIRGELQLKSISLSLCIRQSYLEYRLPILLKSLSRPAAIRRLRNEYGMNFDVLLKEIK